MWSASAISTMNEKVLPACPEGPTELLQTQRQTTNFRLLTLDFRLITAYIT